MNKFYRLILLLLALSLLTSGDVFGAVNASSVKASENESDNYVKFVIFGAPEPVPALQYRLLPPIIDLTPGNAALDWNKLNAVVPADLDEFHNFNEDDLECMELLKLPFDEFKNKYLDHAKKFYKPSSVSFLQHAAYRADCDWQDPIEDGINMLLPSLADLRKISRLVALEARVKVAEGDYEGALILLSYNFALAEDISKGKTIIQDLVGIAIASISYNVIEDVASQPDSPNLYWALKVMPQPLIDMNNAFEYEMSLWVKDGINDLEDNILSVERANKKFTELLQFADGVSLAAIVAAGYVPGKKYLLDNGYDSRRVEMMPAAQVVLLAQWKEYLPLRDNMFKFLFVPYYQIGDKIQKYDKELDRKRHFSTMPNIFYEFLPALSRCKLLVARLQVRADALQCVEAIRMYVADSGRLPQKLSDIEIVPIPENAFTGEEFKYHLDGDTATLDVQDPEEKARFKGYRIKLNK